MYLFAALAAIVATIAGIIMAARTKKAEGLIYGKLDKAGVVTNILLIPVYVILTLFCIALSLFTAPGYEGILGIVGWIVCVIIASAPLFCGIGLGLSVSLRKKGKSKQSFLVQFAGIAGSALSILLFVLCYDNLLSSLN